MPNYLCFLNESRIIPLLTSYKWRYNCYLVLPFAESTLEELWQRTDPLNLLPSVIWWTLR